LVPAGSTVCTTWSTVPRTISAGRRAGAGALETGSSDGEADGARSVAGAAVRRSSDGSGAVRKRDDASTTGARADGVQHAGDIDSDAPDLSDRSTA